MNTCFNQIENKSDYKYIYNIKQALFFLNNGISITEDDIRVNKNSGNVYFRFKTGDELKKVWIMWNKSK